MLHASMDALIKDLNANEAARMLILLDDRLISLINGAEVDRDARPTRVAPAEPRPAAAEPAPAANAAPPPPAHPVETARPTPPPARADAPVIPPTVVAPPAPPRASVPVTQAVPEPPAPAPSPASDIPSAPIMVVPKPAEPAPVKIPPAAPAFPSFEDMIASTARANVESKPEPVVEVAPVAKAAPATVTAAAPVEVAAPLGAVATSSPKAEPALIGPVEAAPIKAAALPPASPPPPAKPIAPPAAMAPRPQEAPARAEDDEPSDDDDDFIEEDFEDGEDLVEAAEAEEKKPGFAGRFLSKFRLPGLGRRAAPAEPADAVATEPDDAFETEDAATPPPAAPPVNPVRDLSLRRLYAAVDQLPVEELLAEAERRTGNRIELSKVADGIELVVKGLPTALGSVRLSSEDGHVVYHPRFGLDLPNREPNRADLELWTKAMGDLVVRVLEDIAERRKARLASEPGSKAS